MHLIGGQAGGGATELLSANFSRPVFRCRPSVTSEQCVIDAFDAELAVEVIVAGGDCSHAQTFVHGM